MNSKADASERVKPRDKYRNINAYITTVKGKNIQRIHTINNSTNQPDKTPLLTDPTGII